MKNTTTNVRTGTTLLLKETHTDRNGFTTFAKTDNENVNSVLSRLEDALSFLYYHALESERGGEEPLSAARAFFEDALEVLKEV